MTSASLAEGPARRGSAADNLQVAIVYTHFPHYRMAVFDELRSSNRYNFQFFYDVAGIDATIRSGRAAAKDTRIRSLRLGVFVIQPSFLKHCIWDRFDAYVFLGNPYILTTWLFAIILRLRGRKIAFWTHGWTRREQGLKDVIRCAFYRLADMLLLYGDRAKRIGEAKGFASERMHVVYNSLDYAAQKAARGRQLGQPSEIDGAYFLCVSRLVQGVELELAIDGIAKLARAEASGVQLVIVGDGPERDRLEARAVRLEAPVRFLGAIYEEDRLAGLFMNCIAVVSPGKIGLLAMHAMAYGTPVITCDDFDQQMPEVEAVEPPITGQFFRSGHLDALTETMAYYLTPPPTTAGRERAIHVIERNYTPQAQRRLIEQALDRLLNTGSLR